VVGDRTDPNNPYAEWFVFHPCHGHYHIRDFSVYELYQLDGVTLAAQGTKQGFCFEDSLKYSGNASKGFDCDFQGITSGMAHKNVELRCRQFLGAATPETFLPIARQIVFGKIKVATKYMFITYFLIIILNVFSNKLCCVHNAFEVT